MKKFPALLLLSLLPAAAPPQDDLGKKLLEVYTSAGDWLAGQQDPDGSWKMGPPGHAEPSPSCTALIITSLASAPEKVRGRYRGAVDKAVAYLVGRANPDGSFGEGPSGSYLKTYTTALALQALSSVDREKHANVIRGAQAYLKQNQLKEGLLRGGVGYGDETPKMDKGGLVIEKTKANLSVVGFAAQGLHMSGLPKDDEFWKLVIEFVRKCQNSSEVNSDPVFLAALKEKGLSVGNDGGLFYGPYADPAVQKAGTRKIADRETIISYGSMTYEGIKTYIYAGLAKDSPEVKAAVDWVRKNYSVDAHPGFAYDARQRNHLRGLYYYYLVMARAMDAFGENPFKTFDGQAHDWPREMAAQLAKSVKESKMWVNENPAWFEGDPVMVTSFVLITCDILFKHVPV